MFAGLYSIKETMAPERRRDDDDQRYSTNTRARITQGAHPAIHYRTMRIWNAWVTYANEGLHRENIDVSCHSVQLGFFTVALCPPTKRRLTHPAL